MDQRLNLLEKWLVRTLNGDNFRLEPASEDASFRRYFRVVTDNNSSFIAMDAPPQQEPLTAFIETCSALAIQQVNSPKIFAKNIEHGFLLLEDFGNTNYLDQLTDNPDVLYQAAIKEAIKIQRGRFDQADFSLPLYDQTMLNTELEVFIEWFVQRHRQLQLNEHQQQLWQSLKNDLIASCLEQPQVWVHRDYHCRNLMVTKTDLPGVIDFQDMVIGPISYDLVSLFKDCYIEWPRAKQLAWCKDYCEQAKQQFPQFQFDQFTRWYDLTGLQRHLKVLGVFCRLNYRDNKAHYMNDLPLVKKYVREVFQHQSELQKYQSFICELIDD